MSKHSRYMGCFISTFRRDLFNVERRPMENPTTIIDACNICCWKTFSLSTLSLVLGTAYELSQCCLSPQRKNTPYVVSSSTQNVDIVSPWSSIQTKVLGSSQQFRQPWLRKELVSLIDPPIDLKNNQKTVSVVHLIIVPVKQIAALITTLCP